jgi:pilus assembly protein Flp/PilA
MPGGLTARHQATDLRRDEMRQLITRVLHDDRGQDLIEYALLAGFISLVAVLAITNVGIAVNGVYNSINTQVKAIPGGS